MSVLHGRKTRVCHTLFLCFQFFKLIYFFFRKAFGLEKTEQKLQSSMFFSPQLSQFPNYLLLALMKCGIFVTIGEPIDTFLSLKFIIYIRVHFVFYSSLHFTNASRHVSLITVSCRVCHKNLLCSTYSSLSSCP